jgi:hypothetical protein
LKYKAFVAPPWGNIMTFPHKDGFGNNFALITPQIGPTKDNWLKLTFELQNNLNNIRLRVTI